MTRSSVATLRDALPVQPLSAAVVFAIPSRGVPASPAPCRGRLRCRVPGPPRRLPVVLMATTDGVPATAIASSSSHSPSTPPSHPSSSSTGPSVLVPDDGLFSPASSGFVHVERVRPRVESPVNNGAASQSSRARRVHQRPSQSPTSAGGRGRVDAASPLFARLRSFLASALLSITASSSAFSASSHTFTNSPAWLLGQCYKLLGPPSGYHAVPLPGQHSAVAGRSPSASPTRGPLPSSFGPLPPSERRLAFMADLRSRFWFSYRSGFPAIHSAYSGVTSDAGWGCMLRSTQMMLGYAFTLHYLGRGWRRPLHSGDEDAHSSSKSTQHRQQQQRPQQPIIEEDELQHTIYLSLLSWFLDSPSSPYSIHALLTTAAPAPPAPSPSVQSASLRSPSSAPSATAPPVGEWFGPTATCQMIVRCRAAQVAAAGGEAFIDVPHILVADDGTIYWEKVVRQCVTRGAHPSTDAPKQRPPAASAEAFFFDPATDSFHPLIVLIPLRLGVDRLNAAYLPSLLSCFQYPQSLGMLGGRPRTSFYFIGVQDERLLYLDPHSVQPALPHSSHLLREADCASFHTERVCSIPATAIDPSLAIGFYLRTWDDWTQLADHARSMEEHDPVYAVVRVRERRGWKGRDEREDNDRARAGEAAHGRNDSEEAEGEGEEKEEESDEQVDDGEAVDAEEVRREEKSAVPRPHHTPRSSRTARSQASNSRSRARVEDEEDDDFVLL